MKKRILIIGYVLYAILMTQHTFAEPRECRTGEFCAIRYETLPDLDLYIEDNKQIIRNISGIIRSSGTIGEPPEGYTYVRNYLVGELNQTSQWGGYDNFFDFYITSALDGFIPEAVYRDYQKLVVEGKRIQRLLNMLEDRGYNDMPLTHEQICSGIVGSCQVDNRDFEGLLKSVLGQIYENNNNIKRLFRLTVTEEEKKFKNTEDIFLVYIPGSGTPGEYFRQQLRENYGANAVAECNQCTEGSFGQIAKSWNSLSQTLKGQSDGYKNWKDAWNLLIGGKESARKSENERALLERELSRQGLQTKNAKIILNNLDEYNNPENEHGRVGGFTWGNNFISNTFHSFINDTQNDLITFKSTIDSSFDEISQDDSVNLQNTYITTEDFLLDKNKIDNSVNIHVEVQELYNLQLEHAQKDDLIGEQLIGRMINTHLNLIAAIGALDTARPIAEEVCDSQATGIGICSYGNHK